MYRNPNAKRSGATELPGNIFAAHHTYDFTAVRGAKRWLPRARYGTPEAKALNQTRVRFEGAAGEYHPWLHSISRGRLPSRNSPAHVEHDGIDALRQY
jgi:hypothetical protein